MKSNKQYNNEAEQTIAMIDTRSNEAAFTKSNPNGLLYTINQKPPLILAIFLGFQQYLTMCSSILVMQLLLAPRLCLLPEDEDRAFLVANGFFVSGIITIIQSTFGTRLPIVQGPSLSFLLPTFAILSLEKFKCPAENELQSMQNSGRYELFAERMNEVQGAIIIASAVEMIVGLSGAIGFLLRFIGPLTIGPLIASIGLSIFDYAGQNAGRYWPMAIMTIILIILFSQVLHNVNVPLPMWRRESTDGGSGGLYMTGLPLFKLLPVFLGVTITWLLCVVLTVSNVLPAELRETQLEAVNGTAAEPSLYHIRTDTRLQIVHISAWFRVPYPFQFGWPSFSLSAVLGMLSGVGAGMLESVGDYYACARLAGAAPPPAHAINRGIAVEGFGCIVAGVFGTGTGSTSYSENISAIGITRVGSRVVIQVCGVIMIVVGMFTKFGALFATIPDPIIGGMFCVMSGMVAAVGISNLQFVNLNNTRNLMVIGLSLIMGFIVPHWLKANGTALLNLTPYGQVNQLLMVLLTTSMFVTGCLALFLDNVLPGTAEDRGLISWKTSISGSVDESDANHYGQRQRDKTYDLPFGLTKLLTALPFSKRIPISPNYQTDQ